MRGYIMGMLIAQFLTLIAVLLLTLHLSSVEQSPRCVMALDIHFVPNLPFGVQLMCAVRVPTTSNSLSR